ncbi:MAG: ABC transporter ATP-binding protein [Puniceicoccaceae bacterium]
MATLEANGICKTYTGPDGKPVEVLKDVDLKLSGSGIHAIVGESGCGKSTLLMICGALLGPDSGTIHINGNDPFEFGDEDAGIPRVAMLGYVFQDFHLIPYLTVEENILASTLSMNGPGEPANCREITERLGLGHRLKHRPGQLSAGEQQRVAIARALLCRPEVVIADEPTGSLDMKNGRRIISILREYADEGGLVLLATHNPVVAENADTVSTIEDLKIVPYSTTSQSS